MEGECAAGDAFTPESHVARMDDGCMARRFGGGRLRQSYNARSVYVPPVDPVLNLLLSPRDASSAREVRNVQQKQPLMKRGAQHHRGQQGVQK